MDFYTYLMDKAISEGIKKIVVGAIITNKNNEVLILTRKKEDFMGGIDELPSGNVEDGEKIYSALKREVKEETNLDLVKIEGYINFFDYTSGSGKKSRQYNFYIKVDNVDDIKLTEHNSYKWNSLNEVLCNEHITKEVKECFNIFKFNYMKG